MKEQIGAKDAGVCDWDDYTVINQTGKLKDGALWIILIAAMMISSLKSTKPSIKSCWNEA